MVEAETPNKDAVETRDQSTMHETNGSEPNQEETHTAPSWESQSQNNTTYITSHSNVRSTTVSCPQCGSTRLYKAGLRYLSNNTSVQRWLCRNCYYRFSQRKPLQNISCKSINSAAGIFYNRQVCDCLTEASKNLTEITRTEQAQREGTQQTADIKGKIVEYSFWLLKQGYSKYTIQGRTKILKRLVKLGANLYDPENVKEAIAKQSWSIGRKANAVDAYNSFLQMQEIKWTPPIYKRIRELPFIPTETEIDQLIAGCNKRMATFLQLLKETGIRCGEACQLKWTDIDTVNGTIRVKPEKGSNPRQLKISNKLVSMLNELPKTSIKAFNATQDAMRKSFQMQRRKIALKLQNPRLLQISFHTFRHWKATMEYHKTKDILHVMQILGHRSIQNTLVYTQLVNFKDDEYTAKVAHSEQEVCQLIEAGFEYVCDYNGNKIFRKRK
ncbi:MAG: tyrosine-type recombinase/integrase [Candidatus Bathyarchaeota archaeon]|nr:tyrosine-type recombinase/integrase [Candidatus Bathyarchaeota archaeon]